MPRPANPANRYQSDLPCPHDGTHERYVKSNDCCACQARYQRNAESVGRVHNAQRRIVEEKRERPVTTDPTKGAAFADSIRHMLRAGR